MSPLKVLARGYAIATRADGRAVREASDVTPGARLELRVSRARIDVEVVAVEASVAFDATSLLDDLPPRERGGNEGGANSGRRS
jgi:hypothetical protein